MLQVGDLSRKNNDLSWSNEELLRMKRSDEAYEELQDTRAMMEVSMEAEGRARYKSWARRRSHRVSAKNSHVGLVHILPWPVLRPWRQGSSTNSRVGCLGCDGRL